MMIFLAAWAVRRANKSLYFFFLSKFQSVHMNQQQRKRREKEKLKESKRKKKREMVKRSTVLSNIPII